MLRRVVAYELSLWRSLYQWLARRPTTDDPGAVTFGNVSPALPIIWAFIVVSAIEVVVVDLIVSRWATVRAVLLWLGGYGLLWMFGLLAAMKVHPHVVSDHGIRVRSGQSLDVEVPWGALASVQHKRRSYAKNKRVQIHDGIAAAVVMSETMVDVVLNAPVTVAGEPVTELRIYVDDPRAFVAEVRTRLAGTLSTPRHQDGPSQ